MGKAVGLLFFIDFEGYMKKLPLFMYISLLSCFNSITFDVLALKNRESSKWSHTVKRLVMFGTLFNPRHGAQLDPEHHTSLVLVPSFTVKEEENPTLFTFVYPPLS